MRRTLLPAVIVAATAVTAGTAACSSDPAAPAAAPRPAATATASPAASPTPSASPRPADTPADLLAAAEAWGTAPQTRDVPGDSVAFRQRIALLWQAVVTGTPATGLGAFFPLSAYRQVKAISDPEHDWATRLVALYDADIAALHASLGPHPTLLGADVPAAAASWVLPGAEYNRESYWRVYGTRVRYTSAGVEHAFGICSLISWRGQWFVVHLGPITRSGTAGALCPPGG